MGLAQNITWSNVIRAKSGWNNSSLSRRNGTTVGLLSTRTPHSSGNTGGGIRNPSYGIGVDRLAFRRGPPRQRTLRFGSGGSGVSAEDKTTFIGQ